LSDVKVVSPPPFPEIKSGIAFFDKHNTCHGVYNPLRRTRRNATQTKVIP
jgi:hypothetical protein